MTFGEFTICALILAVGGFIAYDVAVGGPAQREKDQRDKHIAETGNPSVGARRIATVEGCRIWRIEQGGDRPVYFTHCTEGSATTQAEFSTGGKNPSSFSQFTLGEGR